MFTTDRVRALLTGLLERQASRSADHTQRMAALQNKVADAEGRLSRLYQAIETGLVDFSDETLKGRVAALKTERDQAKAALERAFAELRPETRISTTLVSTSRAGGRTGRSLNGWSGRNLMSISCCLIDMNDLYVDGFDMLE